MIARSAAATLAALLLTALADEPLVVPLPGGEPGIGFDDLRFIPALGGRILVPAGRSGRLVLLDAATGAVAETIEGFGAKPAFDGGHGDGPTSAELADGWLCVTDRTTRELSVVDPATRRIVARAPLGAEPDYVRWVAATRELWVTEPDAERIEIFSFPAEKPPAPKLAGVIAVPGGPESLVIDATRSRAYTHLWKGETVTIDLARRAVVGKWSNGCRGSRGIALDEPRGLLFTGGAEGKATAADVAHGGKIVGSVDVGGGGVDIVDYDSGRSRLYVPSGEKAALAVIGVAPDGALALLGHVPTVSGAHCVAVDRGGKAFVADPRRGAMLVIRDPFPAGAAAR